MASAIRATALSAAAAAFATCLPYVPPVAEGESISLFICTAA